jgi:hypothetical protein
MSLFGNDAYQWRETYFVLLRAVDRPNTEPVLSCLKQGRGHYELLDVTSDEHGRFESLTLLSPEDFSGMDVTYVTGNEVTEQLDELSREIAKSTLTEEDRKKLSRLQQCDARLDIYHFEQIAGSGIGAEGEEEEFLDPGSLIIVLKRLAKLCHGIGVDPQSGTLM